MIQVIIEVTDSEMKALCETNELITNIHTDLDIERMKASDGMTIPLNDLMQISSEEESNNYNLFRIGIVASVITYLDLIKKH